MPINSSVNITAKSRYRYTKIYQNGNVVEWGAYIPPPQFDQIVGDESRHVVTQDEIGFFDKITCAAYGSNSEELWWIICRLNGIVDPENDVQPGQVLLLPSPSRVSQFIGSQG